MKEPTPALTPAQYKDELAIRVKRRFAHIASWDLVIVEIAAKLYAEQIERSKDR